MKVIKIEKSLPKRETFVCDICGFEREAGGLSPLFVSKEAGDFVVRAMVCPDHFTIHQDGKIVYTLPLLQLEFEILNKAKEIALSGEPR